ncbi:phosphatidate cytidylyltransferase [Marivibrio halodurans]|uniref:phosphatidate cytidylyltransferase n=1 Tax=Marivibrio halodurans TaxID=2039722 RepID=UPI0031BB3AB5
MSELTIRALSALVLVPIAAVLIWSGGWALTGLVIVAVGLMLVEWRRMVAAFPVRDRVIALVGGVGVILLCGVSAYALRNAPYGLDLLVWLVLLVVATDIGAYACGRTFGGPKLAPRISPNKTWAGLLGGMAVAVLVTILCALWAGQMRGETILVAALLSAVSQGGDLLESWCKRRAGVKDSGTLIPGHGGILDRLDGFLTATPALWLYHVGFDGGLRLDLPPGPF